MATHAVPPAAAAPQGRPRCDVPPNVSGFIRNDSFIDVEGNVHSDVRFTGTYSSAKGILRQMLFAFIVFTIRILQLCYGTTTQTLRTSSQPFINALPVILVAVALGVMAVDQGTDIAQSYQICNVPCRCNWLGWIDICIGPYATGSGDLENDQCLVAKGNFTLVENYCNIAQSESECNSLEPWSPATYQHPLFCMSSIATILVPSIINSTYLLISLLCMYPSMLRLMGVSESSTLISALIKMTLLVLYILQILPYAWLVANFIINLKLFRSGLTEELVDKENRSKTSKRSKLVFTILEDTPQLLLHSMFIINSAMAQDNAAWYAGIDMLSIMSYLAMSSSAASIAMTLTLFQELPTYKAAGMHFSTTFISVGVRALVCASYASAVTGGFGPLTWPIALPPLTVICVLAIENIFIYIYKSLAYIRQTYLVNGCNLQLTKGIVKHFRTYIESVHECRRMLNYNGSIYMSRNVEKLVKFIVSFTFEAHSPRCLIPSYSYLAFAVAMNTAKISASEQSEADYTVTQTIIMAIQYLSFASLLINLLIVQWEGKDKVYSFVYSLVFLVFMVVIYIWVKKYFKSFVNLYGPDVPDDYVYLEDTVNISLSSLIVVFYSAVIIASSNLLIIISSFIKCKS